MAGQQVASSSLTASILVPSRAIAHLASELERPASESNSRAKRTGMMG